MTEEPWNKPAIADPYSALEWDEDDTAFVKLEVPGKPEWVLEHDQTRFERTSPFHSARMWETLWETHFAFQIKRRRDPFRSPPGER